MLQFQAQVRPQRCKVWEKADIHRGHQRGNKKITKVKEKLILSKFIPKNKVGPANYEALQAVWLPVLYKKAGITIFNEKAR